MTANKIGYVAKLQGEKSFHVPIVKKPHFRLCLKMVKGERFVLKNHFEGLPKFSDFEHVKEDLGDLAEGEIAYETEYISVDPYQRPYTARLTVPTTMMGSQVAK